MKIYFIKEEFCSLHTVIDFKTASLSTMVSTFRTVTIFLTSQLAITAKGLKCVCFGHLRECKGWHPEHGYFCETNAACFAAVFRVDDSDQDTVFRFHLIHILQCPNFNGTHINTER